MDQPFRCQLPHLLKGLLVSLLTYLLYKRVERLFFRRGSTQNC